MYSRPTHLEDRKKGGASVHCNSRYTDVQKFRIVYVRIIPKFVNKPKTEYRKPIHGSHTICGRFETEIPAKL